MKKIAVTQRLIQNESYYEIREALDIQWAKLIFELGFLPIILPYGIEFKTYFNEMNIDGIILTGGNDLALINENNLSKQRDIYETALIDFAISESIPLLGVCRGMQIIGKFFGCELRAVKNQVGIQHSLSINKKSKYIRYLEEIDMVNSYHNYALENVHKDIIISATDKSGMIKAIEHKQYKIFAQMWHSEREVFFKSSELKLLKGFFNND